MAQLYTRHSRALAAEFTDVENHALAQEDAFIGTPGSVLERSNSGGFRFYALQRYDKAGVKKETYLAGPIGDPSADNIAAEARTRIAEQRGLIQSVRLLMREGYAPMEPKHYVAIAALANHGFFSKGGVMVGTHAFEVMLNVMGIRATAFATSDVDVARAHALGLRDVPEGGLLGILRSAGLDFERVPPLDPREPSVKIKEKGRSRFTLDLLVASEGEKYSTTYIPELDAYATALPYFKYLVSQTQPGTVISRLGCAPVRVPVVEKFAIHKLLVSRLRRYKGVKSGNDVQQAAILMAALGDSFPGSIEDAFSKTPVSARSRIKKAMTDARKLLVDYPAALEELDRITAA